MLNGSQRNKDEEVKFSWNDIFYLFLFFFSHRLLAQVAGKKNKFISFRVRSPDNHSQFKTKMRVQNPYPFSDRNAKTIPIGAAHTYIPDIAEYPLPPGNDQISDNFEFQWTNYFMVLWVFFLVPL